MTYTPDQFVADWERAELKERASAQSHFESVCRMIGHALPHELDPKGEFFTYEYGVQKTGGGQGFADVFYRGHFAIEYKGKAKYPTLDAAYQQLLRYRENLYNPPLLMALCDQLEAAADTRQALAGRLFDSIVYHLFGAEA